MLIDLQTMQTSDLTLENFALLLFTTRLLPSVALK